MKLAIVVGHNARSQGATRRDTGESEYSWNGRLAKMIEAHAARSCVEVKTFRRTPGGGYSREIDRVYGQVDRWNADASIELHFNASENPRATGVETLSSGYSRSLILAAHVQAAMVDALALRSRGVKVRSKSQRGGRSLHAGRCPAVLVEPFFATSQKGLGASDEDAEMDELAASYIEGALAAYAAWERNS